MYSHQKPLQSRRTIAAQYSPRVCNGKGLGLIPKGFRHPLNFVPKKKVTVIRAVAVPLEPSLVESAEYREQLAESYGFRQIGEPLPDEVTLKDVIDSLPKKVFEIDDTKAWKTVLISVASYALGLFMISKAPWYLLPLAWAWTGTAVTGFFVIGHDCAHKSFSKNKLVEDIVGTLAFLPLIYPYEPWRFKHDKHHAKTNMLYGDTAWHPVTKDKFDSSPVVRNAIIYGHGPFRTWMSIVHWNHGMDQILANAVAGLSLLGNFTSPMSTFTMVHHTAPHIPFKYSEDWNAAQAQLNGTVHCDYPQWIEILCHDINVHIPHHVSPRIPSYNLRAAHKSLEENWGKYLNEASWNWRLMKTIMTMCHVYDKQQNYVAFDELAPEDSHPITFLKKVMPDYA
ncbi:Omega-6 fatty acid desaturase, chloroplastic [Stylosanthes scabra]|uniref:Omega-6 fatty acid desaturase, chloroplastic n=1 Tax=Stylosanthes scabra TaxID=79078 RepID=A0ABU6S5V5_9FABA|nr:Omega-6 fatty acid desaturase, chloroplastic [Stylosanthes scabra]